MLFRSKNAALDLARFRNRHIGFVFQFHHLLPEFSAIENVMMPLLIGGMSMREARPRALDLLLRVGLQARAAHRPGELSGGEQQRIALARALVWAPDLLLADEPTGNLDERTGRDVHALLRQLQREDGLTAILVTHNERIAADCDRVLRLEARRAGDRLLVSLADTGCGMTEETRARIFDPFYTTKGRGRGTGLGLVVVKQILEEHLADIEVESEPGRGSRFTLRFPCAGRDRKSTRLNSSHSSVSRMPSSA